MKNRRRNREAFREHSYWQSYSDMLAALLLIFILMIAITLAIYRQKTNDLEQTRLELDSAQSELDATIKDLASLNITVGIDKVEAAWNYQMRNLRLP